MTSGLANVQPWSVFLASKIEGGHAYGSMDIIYNRGRLSDCGNILFVAPHRG